MKTIHSLNILTHCETTTNNYRDKKKIFKKKLTIIRIWLKKNQKSLNMSNFRKSKSKSKIYNKKRQLKNPKTEIL